MKHTTNELFARRIPVALTCAAVLTTGLAAATAAGEANLLKNPGFEEASGEAPSNWATVTESSGKVALTSKEFHGGHNAMVIPANTCIEQKLSSAVAGAYLARCWVKSEAEQSVTLLLQDPEKPWAAYNYSEIKVPRGQWVQIESFCALDENGSLSVTLGGTSGDFRPYHGVAGEMTAPIVADDFELIRCEPKAAPLAVWDAKRELAPGFDWSAKGQWSMVNGATHAFTGSPVIQARHLAGTVRKSDGALMIYSVLDGKLKARGVITPSTSIANVKCTLVHEDNRAGIHVTSESGDRAYTAWFTPQGLVTIQATKIAKFTVSDCHLRYGLLPSFAGTDICYTPAKLAGNTVNIPSTQWFVGLVDGNDSMLVAAWESDSQAVAMGLSGDSTNRIIDSLSFATDKSGFSLSFAEHAGIWHREKLNEDWLGEYVPVSWERPFQARWMSQFFVSPGGKPSFRAPYNDYSFPIAGAKTRAWGVWFEDWNHYPFYFDGPRTIFHFEKTFVPNGEAVIYFLEPAAADLFSPVEIVEQALGKQKATALLDFEANRLRRLKYSTPNQFMFDRPVCATTTRLSKIKGDEKGTVGVDLATHLYEFIREIRGRVDQYGAYFADMKTYLAEQKKAHPELQDYIGELEGMVADAQAKTTEIYATPLSAVQTKIDGMKALLREGKGDGFNCGNLDVRDTAGSQDDLCRRCNRVAMRLVQTAAQKCGDSPEKAQIAKHIWDQSRLVLREPTRWESRRTLYFFEP